MILGVVACGYVVDVSRGKMAVQDANRYVHALSEFLCLIYFRGRGSGLKRPIFAVTHDYQSVSGAIPLPVTLSVMLGERLPKHHQIERVRLYSDYPFPWRKDGA